MVSRDAMPTIKVISGATAGEERLVEGDVVIGREDADLLLPDPEVSRRHAVVRAAEGGVEIEDLGSRNGTFVDERRLEGAATLATSATVRIGETRLAVEIAVAQPEVTVLRDVVAQPEVTVLRDVVAQPDVTVQRDVVAQPDVTAQRDVVAQPDVTAQREAVPQADLTTKRNVVPGAEATPATPEPEGPKGTRELLPIIIGGFVLAIAVAVIIAIVLG
jgi:predicted component of type VI protein secretion system